MTASNKLPLFLTKIREKTVHNDTTAGRPRPYRFLHCDWLQPRRKINIVAVTASQSQSPQSHVNNALLFRQFCRTGTNRINGRAIQTAGSCDLRSLGSLYGALAGSVLCACGGVLLHCVSALSPADCFVRER